MPLMLNNVQLAGNLTRDPVLRDAGSTKVASFGLAINRKYKSGDEMKEETTFVDVEAWNRVAELCGQYLSKGRNCLIEGSLKLNQWVDSENVKHSKLTVTAYRIHFIGDKKENTNPDRQNVPESGGGETDFEAPF